MFVYAYGTLPVSRWASGIGECSRRCLTVGVPPSGGFQRRYRLMGELLSISLFHRNLIPRQGISKQRNPCGPTADEFRHASFPPRRIGQVLVRLPVVEDCLPAVSRQRRLRAGKILSFLARRFDGTNHGSLLRMLSPGVWRCLLEKNSRAAGAA